jgi:hypothetical protein
MTLATTTKTREIPTGASTGTVAMRRERHCLPSGARHPTARGLAPWDPQAYSVR